MAGARLAFALSLICGLVGSAVQGSYGDAIPYCDDLKALNNYAMTRERFAPIIGQARNGNYREAKLALRGWMNCMFYGTNTYTCDSNEFNSREDAAHAQQQIGRDIVGCFAGTWAEAPEQMGPDFLVVHPKLGPASITISLDQTDTNGHIVRLIMFLRR